MPNDYENLAKVLISSPEGAQLTAKIIEVINN